MKVIAIGVQTIDGFIAHRSTEFIGWSSKEDKKLFMEETKKAGVVVMGSSTFNTFKKPLPGRLNVVLTSKAKHLKANAPDVEFVNASPNKVLTMLAKRGFKKVFIIGGQHTYTQFVRARLIDELWVTVEPLLFGKGLSLFNTGLGNLHCTLNSVKKINSKTIHIRYTLNYEK